MQDDEAPTSPSGESGAHTPLTVPPIKEVFTMTEEDVTILEEHLEEFSNGNADLRNTIVANVMAELVLLRPETFPFNKAEASKVRVHIVTYGAQILIFHPED
jgi:hypothetical protein